MGKTSLFADLRRERLSGCCVVEEGRMMESAMAPQSTVHQKRRFDDVHPGIFAVVAGLVLLFVVSAFDFGDRGYIDYLLAIVVGFFVIAMGIPFLLWRTCVRQTDVSKPRAGSMRDWLGGEQETWQGSLAGREAATQVLLPIAAVAIGMTAIGIVLLLVKHHIL